MKSYIAKNKEGNQFIIQAKDIEQAKSQAGIDLVAIKPVGQMIKPQFKSRFP